MNRIAVALHDIEPGTFERCALIRDWLSDLGVDRVTLLVIPAPDLHPFADGSPDLAGWLGERRRSGDAVAQHGLHHARLGRRAFARGEFGGLGAAETRRAVLSGRRLLHLAGVEPRGFVAPGYAYTGALRVTLRSSFDWWATVAAVHQRASPPLHAPLLWPPVLRAGAMLAGPLLRVDVHPGDLERPRHVRAIERTLRHAVGRTAVTYDDLSD